MSAFSICMTVPLNPENRLLCVLAPSFTTITTFPNQTREILGSTE